MKVILTKLDIQKLLLVDQYNETTLTVPEDAPVLPGIKLDVLAETLNTIDSVKVSSLNGTKAEDTNIANVAVLALAQLLIQNIPVQFYRRTPKWSVEKGNLILEVGCFKDFV